MRKGALKKRWGFFLSYQPNGGFPTVSITCLFNSYPIMQLFSSSVCGEDFWVGRFYSFFFKLEGNCFTILGWFLLYNSKRQLYACVCPLPIEPLSHPLTLPLPWPLPQVVTSTELSPLCYTAASDQLSILHMVVYICQCYCLNLKRNESQVSKETDVVHFGLKFRERVSSESVFGN